MSWPARILAALTLFGPGLAVGAPRLIELTAVSKDAVWTMEEVSRSTYWSGEAARSSATAGRHFAPATIVVKKGEQVRVRLRAYDNEHGFYLPDLGVGPFEIKAGETKEFLLDTAKVAPGAYLYLCTKNKCSDRHHWMRGYVLVYPENGRFDAPPSMTEWGASQVLPTMQQLVQVPKEPSRARGQALFSAKGCIACHNRGGRGGIVNHNYINGTVPRLNNRGELMALFETADALKVIDVLDKGRDLTLAMLEEMELPRPTMTFSQYQNMLTIIGGGRPDEGKKDVNGPRPALTMPEWKNDLSQEDVNNLLAYLLSVSEYEDGTIAEAPGAIPEAVAPADFAEAVALFQPRPPPGLSSGDRVAIAVAVADVLVVGLYLALRRRGQKPRTQDAGAAG